MHVLGPKKTSRVTFKLLGLNFR